MSNESIRQNEKKRKWRTMVRPDMEKLSENARELWGLFPEPNCRKIAEDVTKIVERRITHDNVYGYMSGKTRKIPSDFMEAARRLKNPPETTGAPPVVTGGAPGGIDEIMAAIRAHPVCPNHQVCLRLATLLTHIRDILSLDTELFARSLGAVGLAMREAKVPSVPPASADTPADQSPPIPPEKKAE